MFKNFTKVRITIFALFVLDRILKIYAIKDPAIHRGFLFDLLTFNFEPNYGIAFGIRINPTITLIITAVVILALFHYLLKAYRQKDSFNYFSILLIIFGAFSNLFDRLYHGFVIDYIDVPFFTVLNIADLMISVGVGLLLVKEFFVNKKD